MLLQLLLLEMRSIWRMTRMRQIFIVSLIAAMPFLLLLAWVESDNKSEAILRIFVLAIVSINLAFFTFSKDSCFFDGMKSRFIPSLTYIQAKYLYLTLLSAGSLFLVTLLSLWGVSSRWGMNMTAFFLIVGFLLPLTLFAASFDRKRIDTSRSAFFNYEGIAWGRQFIVIIPLFLIYLKPEMVVNRQSALFIFGLIGTLCYKFILRRITKIIERRKYLILEGFRE